ncbi:hypothetical protein BC938DRAFT_481880 [Jimgerdemannia flammicorona]|uniref:Uncharacterized protein n=1 Tax=Jimgerdemannia flammicorona TaxID=994334 RepID=A0A433QFA8_9FUNG|nr:hypothetical protein BC938DRAFT_481880 [Jimgerdemannia flammicorona]
MAPEKRKNPFGETANVLRQRAREDLDRSQIYGTEVQPNQHIRTLHNQPPATRTTAASRTSQPAHRATQPESQRCFFVEPSNLIHPVLQVPVVG